MKFTPRLMAEISICTALALVLGFIKFSPVSQGGSISLVMVPIFVLALRHGCVIGGIGGMLLGLIQLLTDAYVVHPLQFILDYPLAYGLLGLAGLFIHRPYLGIILGGIARFLAHFVSGLIFFSSYAPQGINPIIYSLLYNASYMIPEIIISLTIVNLLFKKSQGLFRYEQS